MDKFGFFDLLSALAPVFENVQSRAKQTAEPTQPMKAAAPTPPQTDPFSESARIARAESLLERHDAISRRIDRNNRR